VEAELDRPGLVDWLKTYPSPTERRFFSEKYSAVSPDRSAKSSPASGMYTLPGSRVYVFRGIFVSRR
jgi:hypothetical protein